MYYGGRGRGRGGGRGRGRGGGASSYPNRRASQSLQADDGGDTFVLEPKSKWARVGIRPADVRVEEVGSYSMYGDLDHWESLEPRRDRSLMRMMSLDCTGQQTTPVDFNLDKGYSAEALDGVLFKQQLPVMMKWAILNAEDPKLVAVKEEVDIVSTCTLLADLMQGLYEYSPENMVFGAARVNGKVVVGSLIRPDIHGITQGGNAARFGMGSQDHAKFWGRRFEVYMSADNGAGDAEGLNDKVAAPRFRTVLHTKLRDLNLLLAAGVDAANPFVDVPYPQKYVDFVTAGIQNFGEGKENRLYGGHMLRWWSNNVLNGTGTLHAGVHDNGLVLRVKTFRIDELPPIVQAKEASTRRQYWSAEVCLGFVHALLKFVLTKVVQPHDRVLYEFTCPKEVGAFTCREVPPSTVGHDYLQGDVEDFLA
ncbi:hypothetical protein BV898_10862 [Hypsibius exemplaris]|uniref:Decapping nuclease n=1 Tax=Hypsibius exemplaris TaxID=2072580 RepID=A0A1W0WIB9_HYPEX|nr:hypothetical protein BV898_10862 [Hypsibius exemplaris]